MLRRLGEKIKKDVTFNDTVFYKKVFCGVVMGGGGVDQTFVYLGREYSELTNSCFMCGC